MGKPGSGKTHLCSALVHWVYGKVSSVYGHRENVFKTRIKESFDFKGDFRNEIVYQTDHEFYILDDIGSARPTPFLNDAINEMINIRNDSMKPTVISTNYNEIQIKDVLGHRIHSRLFAKQNTIIDMFGYPDLRMG